MALDLTALIVDDNASLAYFTAYSLKQEIKELKVVTAGSCAEALALADEHQPSVSIVDLNLPDGNGLELIGKLKSRLPSTLSILITATLSPEGPSRDVFGKLTKPYDPEALIDLVRQALKTDDPRGGETAGSRSRRETGSPSRQYDFHHVQNRLSGLLAGIRALRLELLAVADDPAEVRRTIDEYTDRLSAMVKEAAEAFKRKA
jgi:DNA-binding NtrC family response regulator